MAKKIRKQGGISKEDKQFLENFKIATQIVLIEDLELLKKLAKT